MGFSFNPQLQMAAHLPGRAARLYNKNARKIVLLHIALYRSNINDVEAGSIILKKTWFSLLYDCSLMGKISVSRKSSDKL